MTGDPLSSLTFDLAILAGIAAVGGFALALADRLYLHLLGVMHRAWLFVTGVIGVPVHELTHATTALLFGLRVHSVRLFTPFGDPGQLGSVGMSWNRKNLFHRFGLFFVGFSPLVIGSVLVMVLTHFAGDGRLPKLVPDDVSAAGDWVERFGAWLAGLIEVSVAWPAGWWTPLALFTAFSISAHALPSPADLKSAEKGVLFVFVFVGAVAWILNAALPGAFPNALAAVVGLFRWWVAGIVQMALFAIAGLALASVARVTAIPFRVLRDPV